MSVEWGAFNTNLFEEMYARFSQDPKSVDESWRRFFERLDKEPVAPALAAPRPPSTPSDQSEMRVADLIHAYRQYGHLIAKVNPIQAKEHPFPEELKLENLGFHEGELNHLFPTCGLTAEPQLPLKEIVDILQDIYCRNIGVEYLSRGPKELEGWLQKQIEPTRFRIKLSIDQKHMILQHLNKSGLFEWFLQTKYVGQKRFSLEGGETLIPIIAAIVDQGLDEIVIGMAHRGRLNVLSNILEKSYADIFSEFEEHYIPESFEGSGDVKYHKGFSAKILTSRGKEVSVSIAPNPSHLEAVGPVVEGQVRAKQMKKKGNVLPLLIHGDAAVAGQGVVYETMQLGKLEGYSTGGTLHIVINNQIGFTTFPEEGRSTRYCTDIAKTFGAPVFHVNAEDPEGCVLATLLALEMREKFQVDVFIDLNCYRKYGHNEADEPAFTQPLEYQIIRQKKSIRELYRDQLLKEGVLERFVAEELEEEFKQGLQQALKKIKETAPKPTPKRGSKETPSEDWFKPVETGVSKETLEEIARAISEVPKEFNIHKKLSSLLEARLKMVTEGGEEHALDWGMAELLAYGSLLLEKTDVRISGQDCCRGTFSHRHAMWMDQEVERGYFPLQHIKPGQGRFEIYNSPLSEMSVLGFEYGYSTVILDGLTIWEAQFGDFANSAQVMIDQFISTGEDKWRQKSNLVMLLPHGYEGQGPEHSSARIERYLTLCGDDNMFICNPTSPAQLFHLLRRQIKRPLPKPLIVFTPKGLLRHAECVSRIEELTEGHFHEILDDPEKLKNAERLIFCSGRIYYDLIEERIKTESDDVAIVRIEQLYPLSMTMLKEIASRYPKAKTWLWVQEEPSNMGAYKFMRPKLQKILPPDAVLAYVGRDRCASPATGSHRVHKEEHKQLLKTVFPKPEPFKVDINLMHRV